MLRVEGLGKRLGDFVMEGVTFEVADAETGETVKSGELMRSNGELVGTIN